MQKVLLIGSHLLGNATASRRYREILEQNDDFKLHYIFVEQKELEAIKFPRWFKKHQSLTGYLVLRKKLKKITKTESFDIVICMTAQPILALHGLFKSSKIAMWYDSLPLHPGQNLKTKFANYLARSIYNLAFKRVTLLLPMSEWAKKQQKRFDFPEVTSIILSPICVSAAVWQKDLNENRSINKKIKVLMSGNNAKNKGFIDFFCFCQQQNLDLSLFEFTILSNENHPELIALSNQIPIQIITDITHDQLIRMVDYYHQADLFFLPTKNDMMPNVLIESSAAMLPILSTDLGAISELVNHNKTGWLVEAENWQKFYEKLVEFSQNPYCFSSDNLQEHSKKFFDKTMKLHLTAALKTLKQGR